MKNISTFLLLLISFTAFSQVKVGENPNNINPSAVLEAESTNKGFLPPRMTTAQRDAIQNPALGLMVFNTTTSCVEVFYGTFWQSIHCGCSIAPSNLTFTDNGPITYCLNQAIAINSPATQGGNPVLYAVSPVLPAGLFLNSTSGQITGTPTSLSSSANYTITASNACGSTTRVLNIGVITIPVTPSTISGPSAPTINTSANYSITAVSGATSYTWTVPTGWTINSGQGTTTITVTAGTTAGNVTITATNTCGASAASTKAVSPWRPIVATGGTVTNYTANGTNGVNGVQYRVHSFTTVGNSTFDVTDAGTDGLVDYLVVGGGGGGGSTHAGGGGGGGFIYSVSNQMQSQSYNIVVGTGGIGACSSCQLTSKGQNGSSSQFGNIVAQGGGGGGNRRDHGTAGLEVGSAGSSGGGAGGLDGGVFLGGLGTQGQGFNGGNSNPGGVAAAGGGGGGAGGVGQNATNSKGGDGGNGLPCNISGNSVFYSGGGGGGAYSVNASVGLGVHGGGSGAYNNNPSIAGAVNSGGGGGGGGASDHGSDVRAGANGGSGIVIIRYPLTNPNP